jgi:hypothetical protein
VGYLVAHSVSPAWEERFAEVDLAFRRPLEMLTVHHRVRAAEPTEERSVDGTGDLPSTLREGLIGIAAVLDLESKHFLVAAQGLPASPSRMVGNSSCHQVDHVIPLLVHMA